MPPHVPAFTAPAISSFMSSPIPSVPSPVPNVAPSPVLSSVSRAESFNSPQVRELTVDDIDDFEDDEEVEEVDSRRMSRRSINDAADLVPVLPPFATGNSNITCL